MRILFTGASSFTGYWFVSALREQGHEVVCTFTRPGVSAYSGNRKARVAALVRDSTPVWESTFGSSSLLRTVAEQGPWDLFCHHGADVTNYKSDDFDAFAALKNNTCSLVETLVQLKAAGCHRLLLTGSVFESDEGAGEEERPAFSPYGLSKRLTFEYFRYYCQREEVALGKFVIPNPFGPYEKDSFTSYLARTWLQGQTASVRTPEYVRDNIHVDLLACAYADFAARKQQAKPVMWCRPSGYVESQGAFTERFAQAMRPRLGVACAYELNKQVDFKEPLVRYNTEAAASRFPQWNDAQAWDALAAYYQSTFGPGAVDG